MTAQEFINALFAKARAAGIAEFEAYFSSGSNFDVDILDGEIREYTVSSSSGCGFRGVYNGKMGYASTQILDESAVDMLVEGVKTNAQLIETDDGETIYEGDDDYPVFDTDPARAEMSPADKIELSKQLELKVKALDNRIKRVEGCGVGSVSGEIRLVNSKGLDISHSFAMIGGGVAAIAEEDGKPNFGFSIKNVYDKSQFDIDVLAKEAVESAVSKLGAGSIPSGEYRCIFRQDAASTVLATFAGVFSGEAARKGMSLLKGKEGEMIASEAVTLTDNPLLEGGLSSSPFDCEGVKSRSKDVIKNGRLETLLHNRLTAKLLGTQTTGNASKVGLSGKIVVSPTNLYIQPSETSFDALAA